MCEAQATTPMTYATSRVTSVEYAEMVSTVASASAGPGTRRNIGEFTFTTARGLEEVGGQGVARRLSSSTWLDRRDILVELRRRQAVAGQEDWILDVAVELAKEKEGVS